MGSESSEMSHKRRISELQRQYYGSNLEEPPAFSSGTWLSPLRATIRREVPDAMEDMESRGRLEKTSGVEGSSKPSDAMEEFESCGRLEKTSGVGGSSKPSDCHGEAASTSDGGATAIAPNDQHGLLTSPSAGETITTAPSYGNGVEASASDLFAILF